MSNQDIKNAVCKAMKTMPHKDAIRRIRLFGSHLHNEATAKSDIDLLIDFDDKASIGFFALVDIQDAFKKELGKEVDVVTPRALSKYFRDEVLQEAQLLYEQKSSPR
ncbi:MAG TPA: nucleotidyltransferase domain-containing protein [Candidatus Andersenbacteria bacterium]|nr:nucleotidyltransferase domain-containing protein [Candidatus Andersenbacteria bacterium]